MACRRPNCLPPERPFPPSSEKRPPVGLIPLKIPESTNAWAYVPESYDPAFAHGVVVWLHGRGGFEPKELAAQWKDACRRFGLILVAPKAADPAKWQPLESVLISKLLAVGAVEVYRRPQPDRGASDTSRAANWPISADSAIAKHSPPWRPLRRPRCGYRLGAGVAESDPEHRLAFYVARAESLPASGLDPHDNRQTAEVAVSGDREGAGPAPRYLDAGELDELARWIDMLDRI